MTARQRSVVSTYLDKTVLRIPNRTNPTRMQPRMYGRRKPMMHRSAKVSDPGMPVIAEVDVPAGVGRRRSPKLLPRTGPKCLCGMKQSEGRERREDLLRDECPARTHPYRIRQSSRLH